MKPVPKSGLIKSRAKAGIRRLFYSHGQPRSGAEERNSIGQPSGIAGPNPDFKKPGPKQGSGAYFILTIKQGGERRSGIAGQKCKGRKYGEWK